MDPSQVDEYNLLQSCLGAGDARHVEEDVLGRAFCDVLVCDVSDVDANDFGIIGLCLGFCMIFFSDGHLSTWRKFI